MSSNASCQSQSQNIFIYQWFSHESQQKLKSYNLSSKPAPLWIYRDKRERVQSVKADNRNTTETDEKSE